MKIVLLCMDKNGELSLWSDRAVIDGVGLCDYRLFIETWIYHMAIFTASTHKPEDCGFKVLDCWIE